MSGVDQISRGSSKLQSLNSSEVVGDKKCTAACAEQVELSSERWKQAAELAEKSLEAEWGFDGGMADVP